MIDTRLSDLGKRIEAAMKRHGFTVEEMWTRSVKRQVAATGVARMVFTMDNSSGAWAIKSVRGAA